MKYYKVNENGADRFMHDAKITLVINELFTEKEKNKYKIPDNFVNEVNVCKNNTYWFFGARFKVGTFIHMIN